MSDFYDNYKKNISTIVSCTGRWNPYPMRKLKLSDEVIGQLKDKYNHLSTEDVYIIFYKSDIYCEGFVSELFRSRNYFLSPTEGVVRDMDIDNWIRVESSKDGSVFKVIL